MMVPDPNPIDPWPWTLIRTAVSQGLGLVAGRGWVGSSRSGVAVGSSGLSRLVASTLAMGSAGAGSGEEALALAARYILASWAAGWAPLVRARTSPEESTTTNVGTPVTLYRSARSGAW